METETKDAKEILAKLAKLQADMNYIKEHMIDVDTIISEEEEGRLDESLDEFKEGKTTSHEKLKKELGL